MHALSSNHFSVDLQALDALNYLEREHPDAYAAVRFDFPELERQTMSGGSWFDTDAMGVDAEWGSWLVDAIESTGLVIWEDGEPYAED